MLGIASSAPDRLPLICLTAAFQVLGAGRCREARVWNRNACGVAYRVGEFPEAVSAACGLVPATPRTTPDLSKKPERFDRLPASGETVKAYVRTFAATS